ncbi:aspartyl protease family protein [Actinoallomurus vinaceus]|uniref:aspartyl protease family protein n=1 Tax=Actinoallomurus vinaceus TaxID=1080074 RepID=UPI0031E5D2A5
MNRRTFLLGSGVAVGAAGIVLPMASGGGGSAASLTSGTSATDPDQLFRLGRFDAADRGYAQLLHTEPRNAHAVAQRGYIALLSNRFAAAEKYLSRAVALAPGDVASKQRLAETFVRQSRYGRAVPLLQETGNPRDKAFATLFSKLTGTAWRIHGAPSTRVPFYGLDPIPSVEASVNGRTPKKFFLDTYATLDLSKEVAEEAGLRAVATLSGVASTQPVTIYLGILDSFRIGGIEVRNLPVQWIDSRRPPLPDGSQPAGVIGTTVLYHFLATMDYAGQALVLRRKTAVQRQRFRTQAEHAGFSRLPLWLAGDHYPCTLGALRDYGPRVVTLDTGGIGHGLDTSVEIAEKAGFTVDRDHPIGTGETMVYPVTADRVSLGRAVGNNIRGFAAPKVFPGFPGPGQSGQFGFDLIANFTHEFFKPFSITFDYEDMAFYIGNASPGRKRRG